MSVSDNDSGSDRIADKCALMVEDDYVLAREVCNDLKSHGAQVLGPAPTVHYANLIIGKRRLDGAILDIKLFGEDVYQLVDVLIARGAAHRFRYRQSGRLDRHAVARSKPYTSHSIWLICGARWRHSGRRRPWAPSR